jgi:hypothetical protein
MVNVYEMTFTRLHNITLPTLRDFLKSLQDSLKKIKATQKETLGEKLGRIYRMMDESVEAQMDYFELLQQIEDNKDVEEMIRAIQRLIEIQEKRMCEISVDEIGGYFRKGLMNNIYQTIVWFINKGIEIVEKTREGVVVRTVSSIKEFHTWICAIYGNANGVLLENGQWKDVLPSLVEISTEDGRQIISFKYESALDGNTKYQIIKLVGGEVVNVRVIDYKKGYVFTEVRARG